jgi:hypothetical protein
MSQMVELMKSIVSTPAAAAAAPTVTPPSDFAELSTKIRALLEEKKLYKEMGEMDDCVTSIEAKIKKLVAKRDALDDM